MMTDTAKPTRAIFDAERLDEIERIARAATNLFWIVDEVNPHNVIAIDEEPLVEGLGYPNIALSTARYAAHIANMDPSTTLELTSALRAAQDEVERLREALGQISYHFDNQDMSHLDFRVKAAECARHALGQEAK